MRPNEKLSRNKHDTQDDVICLGRVARRGRCSKTNQLLTLYAAAAADVRLTQREGRLATVLHGAAAPLTSRPHASRATAGNELYCTVSTK
ncbi:hypothetical protein E2C01_083215 [Portunus trituberculatus]|uniref:Uncharacterized protein n=1 Tax=Portunus trituberculatus TaxID=210409 RepID=A0A5B7J774_PORTR|nr:hypothetical protein [Portunus trituberculatus]